jgi:hypothetical protein
MTLVMHLVVFFALLGSKCLMGIAAVYLLLPADRRCNLCDAELLMLATPRGVSGMLRLLRIERRWCMECRRESLCRQESRLRPLRGTAAGPVAEPRLR